MTTSSQIILKSILPTDDFTFRQLAFNLFFKPFSSPSSAPPPGGETKTHLPIAPAQKPAILYVEDAEFTGSFKVGQWVRFRRASHPSRKLVLWRVARIDFLNKTCRLLHQSPTDYRPKIRHAKFQEVVPVVVSANSTVSTNQIR